MIWNLVVCLHGNEKMRRSFAGVHKTEVSYSVVTPKPSFFLNDHKFLSRQHLVTRTYVRSSIEWDVKHHAIDHSITQSLNQSVYLDEKYLYLCSYSVYTLDLDSSIDILLRDLWPNCPLHSSWYKQNKTLLLMLELE